MLNLSILSKNPGEAIYIYIFGVSYFRKKKDKARIKTKHRTEQNEPEK